jgi:hypothetical protein
METGNGNKSSKRKPDNAAASQTVYASEAPAVTPEERRHLAESCAFFKAEHYREAAPETIRESDVRSAEEEIDSVIKSCAAEPESPAGT